MSESSRDSRGDAAEGKALLREFIKRRRQAGQSGTPRADETRGSRLRQFLDEFVEAGGDSSIPGDRGQRLLTFMTDRAEVTREEEGTYGRYEALREILAEYKNLQQQAISLRTELERARAAGKQATAPAESTAATQARAPAKSPPRKRKVTAKRKVATRKRKVAAKKTGVAKTPLTASERKKAVSRRKASASKATARKKT